MILISSIISYDAVISDDGAAFIIELNSSGIGRGLISDDFALDYLKRSQFTQKLVVVAPRIVYEYLLDPHDLHEFNSDYANLFAESRALINAANILGIKTSLSTPNNFDEHQIESDATILWLSRLSPPASAAIVDTVSREKVTDKILFAQLAAALNIPHPTTFPDKHSSASCTPPQSGWWVSKPRRGYGGRDLKFVKTSQLASWHNPEDNILQHWIQPRTIDRNGFKYAAELKGVAFFGRSGEFFHRQCGFRNAFPLSEFEFSRIMSVGVRLPDEEFFEAFGRAASSVDQHIARLISNVVATP